MISVMVLFILDIGLKMVFDKAEVFNSGKMAPNTKVIGCKIWQMVKEDSSIRMEMSMKASGLMTKLMVRDFTYMSLVVITRVNGSWISSTDMGKKHGQVKQILKETLSSEKSMVQAPSSGMLGPNILENSLKTKFQVRVFIFGQMGVDTKEL